MRLLILLRHFGRAGLALLIVSGIGACDLYDPAGPAPEVVLSLVPCAEAVDPTAEPCTLEADSASQTVVRVEVNALPPFNSDPVEVTLRADRGTLIAGTGKGSEIKAKTSGGVLTARLLSDRVPGPVAVAASAASVSVETTVTFLAAPPDHVLLRPEGALTAEANGTAAVRVVAELGRSSQEGRPSKGLRVEFRVAEDAAATSVLHELTQVVLSDGDARATASLRSNQAYDSLFVVAEVLDNGLASSDTLKIRFGS